MLGFTVALWWGPGSGRLREVIRGAVTRTASTELGGWFVVVMCLLATAVLRGAAARLRAQLDPGTVRALGLRTGPEAGLARA